MCFFRILSILILFYKTRLSRLNLIVLSSSLNISISLFSIDKTISLINSFLLLISNSFFESLKDFLDNVDSFIVFFLNKVFINKDKKKKKDKEKEKEEENKNIKDIKKKVNKKMRF